jgi:membrane protease YdiL (CAAX protease family)
LDSRPGTVCAAELALARLGTPHSAQFLLTGLAADLTLVSAVILWLKFRYRRPVLMALGWHRPTRRFLIVALTAGFVAASVVILAGRSAGEPLGRTKFLQVALLLATVGPIIEETVFRGFLLPLLRNDIGALLSVLIVAILFAWLHNPTSRLYWTCLVFTGSSYGWLRLASGTTAAAAVMHGMYNLSVFLFQQIA